MVMNREDLELPGSPLLLRTVKDFLMEQKKQLKETGGPDGEYKCLRCGDCCRWNFYSLDIKPKLLDQLYMLGAPYPHGYWVLIERKIHCYMPVWSKQDESNLLHFDGFLPDKHIEFLIRTGRRHGYWVLDTENDKILVYNPVPCIHLVDEGEATHCDIYEDRPQVCVDYTCERYPKGDNM